MSAKRFGGKHSPGGDPTTGAAQPVNKFRGRKAASVDVRSLALFVLPTPILFAAIGEISTGNALRMSVLLFAYVCLMLGAWLVREGQRAHAAYDARDIARPPAFPRKLVAAGLAGIGVLTASWMTKTTGSVLEVGAHMTQAILFGVLTAGAHILAFGIDPMRAKGLGTGIEQAELERVTAALDKAEGKLKSIEDLAHQMRDREIDRKVAALNANVRDMIAIVEKDPRDLSRARKCLGVYLKGAEEATRKYAENHERLNDAKLRTDYLDLLEDLDRGFARGKDKLLIDDRTDLEVEIEVLRDRLEQET